MAIVVTKLPFISRIKHLIATLLLFAVLYSLTNIYSATLFSIYPERLYSFATSLDSNITFIPAMIIPYSWSMILFIASFFMVRTPKQLSTLSTRLIIATLLACLIFYLMPARFSFIRPVTMDWTAFGYQFLDVTDKPFNQLPSLHVTYAMLLGLSLWNILDNAYKWQRVAYRLALALVCALIIVSTIFTYQHHLLDIVAGFLLAAVVIFIANKLHNALVLKYITVAISGFSIIAIGSFFIGVNFAQPAFEYLGIALASYWMASFMILSWLYQADDVATNKRYFRKNNVGKITLGTWSAFAPVLLVYKIISSLGQLYFARRQSVTDSKIVWHSIDSSILISASARLSAAKFINNFIPSAQPTKLIIVDVAAEIDSHLPAVDTLFAKNQGQVAQASTQYLYLPLLDLQPFNEADVPTLITLFEQINQLLVKHYESNKALNCTQPMLVNFHCVMGFSRSIAMQILYLVYCDKLTLKTYQTWINQHYPRAHLSPQYLPKSVIKAMVNAKSLKILEPKILKPLIARQL